MNRKILNSEEARSYLEIAGPIKNIRLGLYKQENSFIPFWYNDANMFFILAFEDQILTFQPEIAENLGEIEADEYIFAGNEAYEVVNIKGTLELRQMFILDTEFKAWYIAQFFDISEDYNLKVVKLASKKGWVPYWYFFKENQKNLLLPVYCGYTKKDEEALMLDTEKIDVEVGETLLLGKFHLATLNEDDDEDDYNLFFEIQTLYLIKT
ncbi:MAG: hypothetical protein R3Y43_06345 [Alphaproteobacteria bacterium]